MRTLIHAALVSWVALGCDAGQGGESRTGEDWRDSQDAAGETGDTADSASPCTGVPEELAPAEGVATFDLGGGRGIWEAELIAGGSIVVVSSGACSAEECDTESETLTALGSSDLDPLWSREWSFAPAWWLAGEAASGRAVVLLQSSDRGYATSLEVLDATTAEAIGSLDLAEQPLYHAAFVDAEVVLSFPWSGNGSLALFSAVEGELDLGDSFRQESFTAAENVSLEAGVGDIDGDGLDDLLVHQFGCPHLLPGSELRVEGGLANSIDLGLACGSMWSSPTGDLDGDGLANLVVTQPSWQMEPDRVSFWDLSERRVTATLYDHNGAPDTYRISPYGVGDIDGDERDTLLLSVQRFRHDDFETSELFAVDDLPCGDGDIGDFGSLLLAASTDGFTGTAATASRWLYWTDDGEDYGFLSSGVLWSW